MSAKRSQISKQPLQAREGGRGEQEERGEEGESLQAREKGRAGGEGRGEKKRRAIASKR